MEHIFLSVIIPAYNPDIEMFQKCVDSVLRITVPMEVLIVDDGSEAGFAEPCLEYAKKDFRIKWVSKANGGVSSARNCGIQKAKGDYLLFVDADDEITDGFTQFLHHDSGKLNADWVLFDMTFHDIKPDRLRCRKLFHVDKLRAETAPIIDIEYADLLELRVSSRKLASSCAKLISRQLVIENGVEFPAGVLNGEDSMFNTRLLRWVNKVQYVPVDAYTYNYSPRLAGRLLSDPYKRYEYFTAEIKELETLINDRAEPAKRLEYIQRPKVLYIEFMLQDCFILYEAGKLDKAMKNFLLSWVQENKLLDGVSLGSCSGMKRKIYYMVVKYRLWFMVGLIVFMKKILREKS